MCRKGVPDRIVRIAYKIFTGLGYLHKSYGFRDHSNERVSKAISISMNEGIFALVGLLAH